MLLIELPSTGLLILDGSYYMLRVLPRLPQPTILALELVGDYAAQNIVTQLITSS
jgi:hypothetical protein